MYMAKNGMYIALDGDALGRLQKEGILKLPMNGQMIVIEITELQGPDGQLEEQPGVA